MGSEVQEAGKGEAPLGQVLGSNKREGVGAGEPLDVSRSNKSSHCQGGELYQSSV